MLSEPAPTAYDLRWRMLGTDVRVHPLFWIMTIILGWSATERGLAFLFVWVACVFVSILVHEMGHVLMGRVFGTRGHIVLYSFGGLAGGSSGLRNPWKRIAVGFAGPLAGFVLYGLVYLLSLGLATYVMRTGRPLPEPHPLIEDVIDDLLFINWWWGILNLLPVWPLDGGQISRDFFGWLLPDNGARIAYGLSVVVAVLLAVQCVWPFIPSLPVGGLYTAILFGLLALGSYQALQAEMSGRPRDRDEELKPAPWQREDDWWKR
jgi:Zn-dependent protease